MQGPMGPSKGFCHSLKSLGEAMKGLKKEKTLSISYVKNMEQHLFELAYMDMFIDHPKTQICLKYKTVWDGGVEDEY